MTNIEELIYVEVDPIRPNIKLLKKYKLDFDYRQFNHFEKICVMYMDQKQYSWFCLLDIDHRMLEYRNEDCIGIEHLVIAGLY